MLWIRPNKYAASYKQQEKIAIGGFCTELPNFIATLVACILTHSALVWADFVKSFQSTLHYGIVVGVSHKLKGNIGDKYNYGVEKIDGFASFVCDCIMVFGFVGLIGYGIYGLIVPSEPSDNLILFLVIKTFNIAFDIFFTAQQVSNYRKEKTKINETELTACISNFLDDSVTMIVAIISYFFRTAAFTSYLAPVYCILGSIFFIYSCTKHMKKTVGELTDRALPVEHQDFVADVVFSHRKICKKFHSVNSRMINNCMRFDLDITFYDYVTYEMQMQFLKEVEADIQKEFPNSAVSLVVNGTVK